MALGARDYLVTGYTLDVTGFRQRAGSRGLCLAFTIRLTRPGWQEARSAIVEFAPFAGEPPRIRRAPALAPECAQVAAALFGSILAAALDDIERLRVSVEARGGRVSGAGLSRLRAETWAFCRFRDAASETGYEGERSIWASRAPGRLRPEAAPSPLPDYDPGVVLAVLAPLWALDERITRLLPPPGSPLRP